jgi:inorganic pyrophosphatase
MEFSVVIVTPMGSRNKYEMDPAGGQIRLDRTLFTATRYPADYGFIPDTLAEDGDPLDALVLVLESTFPGCWISARAIGVFCMRDEQGLDAKLLCVPSHDPRHDPIRGLSDLPQHLIGEVGHFFEIYKQIEPGKCTEVQGWQDREVAERVAREAFVRFGG